LEISAKSHIKLRKISKNPYRINPINSNPKTTKLSKTMLSPILKNLLLLNKNSAASFKKDSAILAKTANFYIVPHKIKKKETRSIAFKTKTAAFHKNRNLGYLMLLNLPNIPSDRITLSRLHKAKYNLLKLANYQAITLGRRIFS
jgi:hypothetical protein